MGFWETLKDSAKKFKESEFLYNAKMGLNNLAESKARDIISNRSQYSEEEVEKAYELLESARDRKMNLKTERQELLRERAEEAAEIDEQELDEADELLDDEDHSELFARLSNNIVVWSYPKRDVSSISDITDIIDDYMNAQFSDTRVKLYTVKSNKFKSRLDTLTSVHGMHRINNNSVLFYYDNTVFGSAKEGFVLTERQLCYKNAFDPPKAIPVSAIRSISDEESKIIINDTEEISCITGKGAYEVASILTFAVINLQMLKKFGKQVMPQQPAEQAQTPEEAPDEKEDKEELEEEAEAVFVFDEDEEDNEEEDLEEDDNEEEEQSRLEAETERKRQEEQERLEAERIEQERKNKEKQERAEAERKQKASELMTEKISRLKVNHSGLAAQLAENPIFLEYSGREIADHIDLSTIVFEYIDAHYKYKYPSLHSASSQKFKSKRFNLASVHGSDKVGDNNVLLFYDNTVFGGAKDGFVLTTERICYKNFLDDARSVALDEISDIAEKDGKLCVNNTTLIDCNAVNGLQVVIDILVFTVCNLLALKQFGKQEAVQQTAAPPQYCKVALAKSSE